MTTALQSRLQFAVYVLTWGRASSGKWFTARFFATKNCTASRLKAWISFLYPLAMCFLDFWSRINELLLFFRRLKWCTSTWWSNLRDRQATRTTSKLTAERNLCSQLQGIKGTKVSTDLPFHPFLYNPTILKRKQKAIRPGFLHDEGELRDLENYGYLWEKKPWRHHCCEGSYICNW